MISSQALHLGSLMIPWPLIISLIGLISVLGLGHHFKNREKWSDPVWQRYKDSLWTSIWISLFFARAVFVLTHYDLYFSNPIDIIKIQDKGFNFIAGIVAGSGWFIWKNYLLKKHVLVISICLFGLVQVIGNGFTKNISTQQQGYPDLSFEALDQQPKALEEFIGKPTVVNLWASWCPPCHREMPVFNQAQLDNPNVQFVFINQGETSETIKSYLDRNEFNFKHVLLDPSGEMAQSMKMFGLPSTLFFNEKGELIERHMGELSEPMLKQYLEKINVKSD